MGHMVEEFGGIDLHMPLAGHVGFIAFLLHQLCPGLSLFSEISQVFLDRVGAPDHTAGIHHGA